MADALITRFDPDPDLLAVLRPCTDAHGVGDPAAEWPYNVLSRRTVVYGSGAIARAGDPVRHAVAAEELELCRRLSDEVAVVVRGGPVPPLTEVPAFGPFYGTTPFRPFFVAVAAGDPVPARIDAALVRTRFGGTIIPQAEVAVEPLAESAPWWEEMEAYLTADEQDWAAAALGRWRAMVRWFQSRPEFVAAAYVRIGDNLEGADPREADPPCPPGVEDYGVVVPRLAVGLTPAGSLVGLFAYDVKA